MLDEQNGNTVAEGEVAQGANQEVSPASTANSASEQPASGAVNSAASQVPFHKNPEFQSYLDRQIRGREREWNKRLEETQAAYEKKLQEFQSQFRQPNTLSEQDRTQLRQLAQLIKSDPEAARELGITDISQLKQELESFRAMSTEQIVSSEASETSRNLGVKYGFEPKDFEARVWDFIRQDDYWGNQPMSKGVFTKAARDYVSENSQEFAERAANLKLVTENKEKTKASSQKPAGVPQKSTAQAPRSMREAIQQAISKHQEASV